MNNKNLSEATNTTRNFLKFILGLVRKITPILTLVGNKNISSEISEVIHME